MKKLYIFLFTILTTAYSSFAQTPTLKISGADAPPSGSTITDDPETVFNATIDFETTNFNVGEPGTGTQGNGYIVWDVRNQSDNSIVDSGNIYTANDNFEYAVSGLSPGLTFILRAELVDNDGNSLNPAVVYTLTVIISQYIDVANLAALRTGTVDPDTYYRVTGQVINTHTISSTEQIMYFQDGTAGIMVYDPNFEVQSYNTGDGVSNIRGHLEQVSGVLQFVPTFANWGNPNTTGNTPSISSVTINDLNNNYSDYESELVKIFNVTFADAGGAFFVNQAYSISDASGITTFATAFSNSDYLVGGQNTIPTGGQDIVAIVTGSSVTSRNSSDIASAPLSIDEFNINSLSLYPNPTSLGHVTLSSKNSAQMSVSLFDLLGKQVFNKTLTSNKLDVSDLNSGIYIIKVSQDNAHVTKKLVIQ